MPKKTKNDPARATAAEAPPAAIASAPKSAARKATAKKKPTASAANKAGTKSRSKPAPKSEPTDAEIRLRAYFIAERRLQLGLPGDSDHDWLEARRQLTGEAARRPS